jgi:hypothetical protein
LKRLIALYVAALIVSLARFAPAAAQAMQPFYFGFAALPPHQIVAIVRSTGLDPLSRPARQGPVYVLRAADRAGQEVRVIVDARMGRIIKVVPLAPAAITLAPETVPPGQPVPDGNSPNSRIPTLPIGAAATSANASSMHCGDSGPRLPRTRRVELAPVCGGAAW